MHAPMGLAGNSSTSLNLEVGTSKIYCRCLELEVVRSELWLCLGDFFFFFFGADEDK